MREILPERFNFEHHFPREGGATAIYFEKQKKENLLTISDGLQRKYNSFAHQY